MTRTSALPQSFNAAIFDLDGVIVNTAKFHYLAWKKLAAELGFDFSEIDNERLKGVSRMRSLEILLELGKLSFSEAEMAALAERKNRWYVELISQLDASELLPGSRECLEILRQMGVPTALASASKNAGTVIERLGIAPLFQYVVDAARVAHAKPDPEIFLTAAKGLRVKPSQAVVFEDAPAGVEAAHAAGMYAIGVGNAESLPDADHVVPDLAHINVTSMFKSGSAQ